MPGPLNHDSALDAVALATAAARLQKKFERLARLLSEACDDVDAAAKAMEDLVERLGGADGVGPQRRLGRSVEDRRFMRAEAKAGASSVQVLRHADGRAEVSVNGRPSFPLAPKLATLLAILAGPGETADDGLPAWQTTSEVATALNRKTGRAVAPAAVPRLVYNLREAFRDAGENSLLVCTSRGLGVRLAVRR